MPPAVAAGHQSNLGRMQRLLGWLLGLGIVGQVVELYLLGHTEEFWQWVPFVVLVLALAALIWLSLQETNRSVWAMRISMGLLVIGGVYGVYLHFQGNREFQLEIDSELAGFELLAKVLHAKAPPALAPATTAQLGLLGWIATVGRPTRNTSERDPDQARCAGSPSGSATQEREHDRSTEG